MDLLWEHKKKAGTTTIEDFRRFPIWTLEEKDNGKSYEIPIQITDPLNEEDEDLVIFVYCTIRLYDGTSMEGVIYINLVNRQEFGLHLVREDEEFSVLPINTRKVLKRDTLAELFQWLGKPLERISPLTYTTPYRFGDGNKICGEIDLTVW